MAKLRILLCTTTMLAGISLAGLEPASAQKAPSISVPNISPVRPDFSMRAPNSLRDRNLIGTTEDGSKTNKSKKDSKKKSVSKKSTVGKAVQKPNEIQSNQLLPFGAAVPGVNLGTPAGQKIDALRDKLGLESLDAVKGKEALPGALGTPDAGGWTPPIDAREPASVGAAMPDLDPRGGKAGQDRGGGWRPGQRADDQVARLVLLIDATDDPGNVVPVAGTFRSGNRPGTYVGQSYDPDAPRGSGRGQTRPVLITVSGNDVTVTLYRRRGPETHQYTVQPGGGLKPTTPRSSTSTARRDGGKDAGSSSSGGASGGSGSGGSGASSGEKPDSADKPDDKPDKKSQPAEGGSTGGAFVFEGVLIHPGAKQEAGGSAIRDPKPGGDIGAIIERDRPITPEELRTITSQPGVDDAARSGGREGGSEPPASRFMQPKVGEGGSIAPAIPGASGVLTPGGAGTATPIIPDKGPTAAK